MYSNRWEFGKLMRTNVRRCKWKREDGTCALDGLLCFEPCEFFEPKGGWAE